MSATDRENRLLVAEDWTKIYQSFRNADFQSYDFENLRRTMVNYLRQNYPEDFNDYIESSEYLALIDLIAFVGQNVAFRVDINARENFLELAERRDSVLRLARLVSYNAKRNLAASGLMKITTIQTTESVIDGNGRDISSQVIAWNDPSNPNWLDQFLTVMNAALPTSQQFGNPAASESIYGIPTEQYRFQSANTDIPVYSFSKVVSGQSMSFEITSTTFKGQTYIYEEPPKVGNNPACVYRDDGQGAGSTNSGFFFNFTQGSLNTGTFTINQPSTSETLDIDTPGINNTDVWLYQLNMAGLESDLWTQVPNLHGNNIIYNSINNKVKNIYGVTTKASDAISLAFSDGTFGNLPTGTFRVYYRISNGLSYVANSQDIRNVTISIPYYSATNQIETLTISLALVSSVSNSSSSETNDSVKTNAPQTYYTQNRMITGEDYNISPLGVNQQVLKVKAVNRTSSGISRYFDLVDPTSKYSSTTLFADDGVLYSEPYMPSLSFSYLTKTDIENVIYNQVFKILSDTGLQNFYYQNFVKNAINDGLQASWNQTISDVASSTGTIIVTSATSPDLEHITVGSLVKFVAPFGYYFDTNNSNKLVSGTAISSGSSYYVWAEVIQFSGVSYTLNKIIPSNAIINSLIPTFTTTIGDSSIISTMIDLVFSNQPFGLRYDISSHAWDIIFQQNLNTGGFSLTNQGDVSNSNLDSSWLVLFSTNNQTYTVTSRELRYVFESDTQLSFYFDGTTKIYDPTKSTLVNDVITVLSINTNQMEISSYATGLQFKNTLSVNNPTGITIGMVVTGDGIATNSIVIEVATQLNNTATLTLSQTNTNVINGEVVFTNIGASTFTNDMNWQIVDSYTGEDGYTDPTKVVVSFLTSPTTGVVIDPDLFNNIVVPTARPLVKYILEQKYNISAGQEDYRYVKNTGMVIILPSQSNLLALTQYIDGQYFYFVDVDVVKQLSLSTGTLVPTLDYRVRVGRDAIKFQYTHAADYESRIDPGVSNIMDVYVLTSDYDTAFRQWLAGVSPMMPKPPSSDVLYNTLAPSLNLIKAMSDEVIYHPVSYTVLFGPMAAPELQANFMVIKNPEQVISDNDIQTGIISAINKFFAVGNWGFGDTFYFTEMATYVTTQLAPYIVSFVIVPTQSDLNFGSLFEIIAGSEQLFISGATVANVVIISGITTDIIKSVSGLTTTASITNQTITSAPYGNI